MPFGPAPPNTTPLASLGLARGFAPTRARTEGPRGVQGGRWVPRARRLLTRLADLRRIHGRAFVDLAKHLFVAVDVAFEGALEALGVTRGQDDARADARTRPARLHVDEVEGEFGVVVVEENQVAVGPLGRGIVELDLELGGIGGKLGLVGHVEVVPQGRL